MRRQHLLCFAFRIGGLLKKLLQIILRLFCWGSCLSVCGGGSYIHGAGVQAVTIFFRPHPPHTIQNDAFLYQQNIAAPFHRLNDEADITF